MRGPGTHLHYHPLTPRINPTACINYIKADPHKPFEPAQAHLRAVVEAAR
jgi:hypothetical protein